MSPEDRETSDLEASIVLRVRNEEGHLAEHLGHTHAAMGGASHAYGIVGVNDSAIDRLRLPPGLSCVITIGPPRERAGSP